MVPPTIATGQPTPPPVSTKLVAPGMETNVAYRWFDSSHVSFDGILAARTDKSLQRIAAQKISSIAQDAA
ncbi:hypothetical protein [Rubripirellula reticaptiva]|uniref:hypothetical protein n=1 Tax=Rubripirellula reticaptiva TaxID=2528013 RepID=UPI001C967BE6|nr:hypothetical protein [Rubripirellula reticaptiva]